MSANRKHLIEYILFFTFSVFIAAILFRFHYDPGVMKILIIFISVFYSGWGIIHSALEGRLARSVFLEYALFGILVYLLLTIAQSF